MSDPNAPTQPTQISPVRVAIASSSIALALGYTTLVSLGWIDPKNRIDAVGLAFLVLGALIAAIVIRPDLFTRLNKFKVGGMEIELLQKIEERQVVQGEALRSLKMILPLVFPEAEQKHLLHLHEKPTVQYTGNQMVRNELRRLASIGMIQRAPGKTIAEMEDGKKFVLSHFVSLTTLGRDWAIRIGQFRDESKKESASPASAATEA